MLLQDRKAYTVNSEQWHTIERFSIDFATGSLHRTYEAEDPLYWEEKQTGDDTIFLSDISYERYNCDDRSVE